MMMVERAEAVEEIEARVAKSVADLMSVGENIDALPRYRGTAINRSHPAIVFSTPEGTFLATIERTTTAVQTS